MGCASPGPFHWQDLRSRPADEILRHEGVKLTPGLDGYEVAFLDALYRVDPIRERIAEIGPKPDRPLAEEFQILLIRYLVSNYGGPLEGREISEKDLPGGVLFFQGPHALSVEPIASLYGRDPDAFEARGAELNAVPVQYGDKAMRFTPFPLLPVTYVLWREDEEFPASVSVLFDASIVRWFALDMVFTLVLALTQRIVEGQSGRGRTKPESEGAS